MHRDRAEERKRKTKNSKSNADGDAITLDDSESDKEIEHHAKRTLSERRADGHGLVDVYFFPKITMRFCCGGHVTTGALSQILSANNVGSLEICCVMLPVVLESNVTGRRRRCAGRGKVFYNDHKLRNVPVRVVVKAGCNVGDERGYETWNSRTNAPTNRMLNDAGDHVTENDVR